MTDSQPKPPARRQAIRREEDRLLRRQLDRHVQLFQVGQVITAEMNFDVLFDVIIDQTTQVIDTERCSIFLADEQRKYLRLYVATDLQRDEVRIPISHGVAGWVFSNQVPVIINNAYEDPRFFAGVDRQTGFQTRSILCVPLIDRKRQCIGTMQVLNKKAGDFSDDDREILIYLAGSVTVAMGNAIENSPDESRIEVSAALEDAAVRVDVRDHGVGITRENRKEIFSGFYHTQDTAMYTSKRPYQLNAGGTGTDLLRMKIFAQRFGFSIDYENSRCPHLPRDAGICSGKISKYRPIHTPEDCLASGGAVFTLRFPVG